MYGHDRSTIKRAITSLEEKARQKEEQVKRFMNPQSYSPLMVNLVSQAIGRIKQSSLDPESLFRNGEERMRALAIKFKKEIDEHPWISLGKVGFCSFGLGLVLGKVHNQQMLRRKRKK